VANGAVAACGLRLEFDVGAGAAALAEPRPMQLQGLADGGLPPAELLARLARCGLDLRPRRADAALVARGPKVLRRGATAGAMAAHVAGCAQDSKRAAQRCRMRASAQS
jgi:hypothetical protein